MRHDSTKFWFDESAADRVCAFFERYLRHSKGQFAGHKFELLDWQRDQVIRPLFGWKRRSDNTRRYRRAYIEIPKKNGKSSLCAGIALYLLLADNEPGAEVYSAATDREQASIIYREAASMVRKSPALSKRLRPVDSRKTIAHKNDGTAFYRALSKETATAEGMNIHGLVFDELHVQHDRTMWDTLTYGGAARRQPLQVAITTAGEYDPESIGWEEHKYAEDLINGMIQDDSRFAIIWAADKLDDWKDPKIWAKANPSLGQTISLDNMAEAVQEAINKPSKLNSLLRYRFNIWTAAAERWIDPGKWQECNGPCTREMLAGRRCYGGLDLSSKIDLTSACYAFPPVDDDPLWRFLWRCWIPRESMIERIRRDGVQYDRWEREGWLSVTDGNVIDYDFIENAIRDDAQYFDLQEIAFDPWNATQTALRLQGEGLKMIEFRQGYKSFSEPMKEFEKLYISRSMAHGDNPIATWTAANVMKLEDANENCRPDKANATARIDPIVAAIMALGRALVQEKTQPSVYVDRGIISI